MHQLVIKSKNIIKRYTSLSQKTRRKIPKAIYGKLDINEKISEEIKRKSIQKIKLHLFKTQKLYSIKKLLIYTDIIDNKSYFVSLKAYTVFDVV